MSKTKTKCKLKSSWNWNVDCERKKSTEDKLHKMWNSNYFCKKTAKRAHPRTAKSYEQLENGCLLIKFWKPFVNWFSPSDGRGNFGAFSTCSRRENQFPYRTRKIPNSAIHIAAGRTIPGFAWYTSWKCCEAVNGEWSLSSFQPPADR